MGKLIKNHWARLIVLSSGAYQVAAGIQGFFWPKILWDFSSHTLDVLVKPVPILQILNIIFGLCLIAWEYPAPFLAGSSIHRSIEARLAFLPLAALVAALMYESTNAAIYHVIAMGVYILAYGEAEVICKDAWTVPAPLGAGGGRV